MRQGQLPVYPACAGIHLIPLTLKEAQKCLPRMRGDPPAFTAHSSPVVMSTPHARGSTPHMYPTVLEMYVYPACAGIHLNPKEKEMRQEGLPRMRGDPPH